MVAWRGFEVVAEYGRRASMMTPRHDPFSSSLTTCLPFSERRGWRGLCGYSELAPS